MYTKTKLDLVDQDKRRIKMNATSRPSLAGQSIRYHPSVCLLSFPPVIPCQVGEAPVGYGYVDLSKDDLSYTISGLNPGISYTVFVSALNRHGQGARSAATGSVTLPLTVPSAPTDVTVATKDYSVTEGDGIGDPQVKTSPEKKKKVCSVEQRKNTLSYDSGERHQLSLRLFHAPSVLCWDP